MKKLLLAMIVVASAMSVAVTDAEAKRMGGGGSFGRQSQNIGRPAPAQNPAGNATRPAAPAAAPVAPAIKPPSPWKSMLGGALLGLGMGALLSHFGLGGAMGGMLGSILMIVLAALTAMFIFRLFRSRTGPQPVYAGGYDGGRAPEIGSRIEPAAFQNNAASTLQADPDAASWGVPADFDVQGFLRNAKTYFLRLQASWDKADSSDILTFTTPEMYAEIKMQLQERGTETNHTDVVTLNAELLGVETVGGDHVASVKFTGNIKEAPDAVAEPFSEIWHLSKAVSGQGGWILAGIQQIS